MGWISMSERDLRRIEVLSEVRTGRRTVAAAAAVLAVSERQTYRLLARYERELLGIDDIGLSLPNLLRHLRHSRPDTTAHEYMQELPESVQQMVGSVYLMLTKGGEEKRLLTKCRRTSPTPSK